MSREARLAPSGVRQEQENANHERLAGGLERSDRNEVGYFAATAVPLPLSEE